MDRRPSLTLDQLHSWAAEWARRLFLSHWDVRYTIARLRDTESGDALGECHWAANKHVAAISVLDPIDHDPKEHWPYDAEQILVHELIHLHFSPFFDRDKESPAHKAQEQAIDLLARAFVAMKRESMESCPSCASTR